MARKPYGTDLNLDDMNAANDRCPDEPGYYHGRAWMHQKNGYVGRAMANYIAPLRVTSQVKIRRKLHSAFFSRKPGYPESALAAAPN
jgi:hypothetical protein